MEDTFTTDKIVSPIVKRHSAGKAAIVVVSHVGNEVRKSILQEVESAFKDNNLKILQIHFKDLAPNPVLKLAQELNKGYDVFSIIYDPGKIPAELITALNIHRNTYARIGICSIFWIPEKELRVFNDYASNFLDFRTRFIEIGPDLLKRDTINVFKFQVNKPADELSVYDYDISPFANYLLNHDDNIRQICAHLMYLTGGHPGCILQVQKMYHDSGLSPDTFYEHFHEEIWHTTVSYEVEVIRSEISSALLIIIDRLSVFRYLDHHLLKRVLNHGNIASLINDLAATHIYEWNSRLLISGLARRLMAIRLRYNDHVLFNHSCNEAKSIYAAYLKDQTTQMPERWAIEFLFQTLQQEAGYIQEKEHRDNIRERFYNHDLPQVLQILLNDRVVEVEVNALKRALKEDWEFQFTVNYYLRRENYNDEPFNNLLKGINHFVAGYLIGNPICENYPAKWF